MEQATWPLLAQLPHQETNSGAYLKGEPGGSERVEYDVFTTVPDPEQVLYSYYTHVFFGKMLF